MTKNKMSGAKFVKLMRKYVGKFSDSEKAVTSTKITRNYGNYRITVRSSPGLLLDVLQESRRRYKERRLQCIQEDTVMVRL